MANLPTDTDQQKTVERVKTPPIQSGALLHRNTPVLEFATVLRKGAKGAPSGEFLDASAVEDDVAPRRAAPPPLNKPTKPAKPLYPVIDRIIRRTRIETREGRSGTPWWLAAVVMGGLAIVGTFAGLSATGRLGPSAPPAAASVVSRTASVVAGRFALPNGATPVAAAPVDQAAPIVKASWTPHPTPVTEHPLAATSHVRPGPHGGAHGAGHAHGAKLHPKKSHAAVHA